MKNKISKCGWIGFGLAPASRGLRAAAGIAAWLLAASNLTALPLVQTVTGGPSHFYPQTANGYVDGGTAADAKFNTPYGVALDSTGDNLFVADRDNNAIRQLDLVSGQTFTFTAEAISKPVGVAVDSDYFVYVLNRGNGNNGTVLKFDGYFGDLITTYATGLINAAGIALDGTGNMYVTVQGNTLIKITPAGVQSTITSAFPAGTSLQGLVVKHNGLIAACDSGRHGIYLINPNTGVITTNAGFHGAGDFTNQLNTASSSTAKFNQPYGVVEAGDGTLVVTDNGNHRVKVVLATGAVTNLYAVKSNFWVQGSASQGIFPGWWDGTVCQIDALGCVEARSPVGIAFAPDGSVYTTETYYHLIRHITGTGLPLPPPPVPVAPVILTVATNFGQVTLTWSTVTGATNYYVKRSPSSGGPYATLVSTTATSFTDTNVINGSTYYYIVSASNGGGEGPPSNEVIATPPLPPVPDPQIGYVDFPAFNYTSVFHPVSSYDFFNDATIVINGTPGSDTYYTYGYTTNAASVPNPTSSSGSIPSEYQDGLFSGQVPPYTVPQTAPFLTIKAIGAKSDGSPNSAVVSAAFQFKTGNPNINGDNAAQFTISDITAGAHLYYTLDGTDPSTTNFAPNGDLGTVPTPTNVWTVSFAISTNTTFKVRAFRANYQPSAVVSTVFSATNFNANKITFGFASGEASSDFVASPGQIFYAPVTLSILPQTKMYSLQFNVTVTNINSLNAVTPGAVTFQSMLVKPSVANPLFNEGIPTAMFLNVSATNPPPVPPPGSVVFQYNGSWFQDLRFVDTSYANLIGVGWLERKWVFGTNLYNTQQQDLIKYSQPHDTVFDEDTGRVVPGGYAFLVPTNAVIGNLYQIKLDRPSATSDGVGAPGSDVYIATPTNGSLAGGTINAIKNVSIGQRKYIVGDAASFRWFNAGDFGNSNLLNDDVMQVFQSAIYGLNQPPPGSDFEDSMDSCCGTYVAAPGTDYLVPSGTTGPLPLFDGNDTTINNIAFGDGTLDVSDIYVTFRRSLDPSLHWFRRFWTNGIRVATAYPAPFTVPLPPPPNPAAASSEVRFYAGDGIVASGQTVFIPISASIHGSNPLRVLALGLTVQPLDGTPAITAQVQFTPAAGLGAPAISQSRGPANFTAAWLNSAIAGLSGDAQVGTLQITLPSGCPTNSAYAIVFDHASGSPNGIAPFPAHSRSGLVTLRDRSGSTLGDGISDSWRLRYFGTINNVLSLASADADGDGANNLHESKAGTNPNDATSVLKAKSKKGLPAECVVQWPSVSGKQYVIERAASIYAPAWTSISTNAGTGWDMEYHDTSAGAGPRFYRVRVQ
ncbi:MAG: hypothetical protein EXS35_04770 [Pedosphaera sp.]|nr:hypothetical protein [Pedosphaera sp.]